MVTNFLLFGLGIILKSDLAALGAGLALINAPLYGYIFGETIRPSNKVKDKKQQLNG